MSGSGGLHRLFHIKAGSFPFIVNEIMEKSSIRSTEKSFSGATKNIEGNGLVVLYYF
jgi:hypothetical protein